MKIRKTIASALLLFTVGLITACSGGDTPPEATTATDTPTIVANAGPDQSVFIGTFVTLNGSKSTNANQTGLTYTWTLTKPASSKATLSNPILVNPALTVDVEGTYEATLVVTDAQNSSRKSAPATVIVIASKTNPPPVAKVEAPSSTFTSRTVLLNGSGSSDANGDRLTFTWRLTDQPSGSVASLLDFKTVAPSFTPDKKGTYEVELIVHDGTNPSSPISVTISAKDKLPPTAVPGTKKQLYFPVTTREINLDGSASYTDPPGGELEYQWVMNDPPLFHIENATSPKARFFPEANVARTYTAQLTVTEKNHPGPLPSTSTDTVLVTVGPLALVKAFLTTNLTNPVLTCNVSTCGMATVPPGTAVKLDATESTGEGLTYEWNVTPSTGFTPSTLSGATPVFTPNTAATGGTAYQINLTVKDAGGNTDIRSFTITAKPGPTVVIKVEPPTPRWPQSVKVSLDPPTSDTNLGFSWTFDEQPSGSQAGFAGLMLQSTTFTTDKPGDYRVRLTVTDNSTTPPAESFNTQLIQANNVPVAVITGPSSVDVCSKATFTSASTDDGSISSWNWNLVSQPDGSTQTLSTSAGTASFKAVKAGDYKVSLSVTDNLGVGSDTTDEKTITSRPNPDGQAIFTSTGLSGMTANTTLKKGPMCADCHGPGNNLSVSKINLNNSIYTVDVIKTKPIVTGGHEGTTTTLTGQNLIDALTALRKYLDSTLTSCP